MESDKSDEDEQRAISKQIVEYYKNYSLNKELPKYFSGSSMSYMPEIVLDAPIEELPVEPPATISPASSVTSLRKLEWDNGADIGYSNCDKSKLHKSASLPALLIPSTAPSNSSDDGHKNVTISSSSDSEPKKDSPLTTTTSSNPTQIHMSTSSSSLSYLKSKIGTPFAESTPKVTDKRDRDCGDFVPVPKRVKDLCTTKPIVVECISKAPVGSDKKIQTSPEGLTKGVQTGDSLEGRKGGQHLVNNQSLILIKCDSDRSCQSSNLQTDCDSFKYYKQEEMVSSKESPVLGAPQSGTVIGDVNNSLEILHKLLKSKKYDPTTKKRYIRKIVKKICENHYSSDTSHSTSSELFVPKSDPSRTPKLQENMPYKASELSANTFSEEFVPVESPEHVPNSSGDAPSVSSSSNSWKESKAIAERILERGQGDHLVKFARNERKHQIAWINDEISHLTKLRGLLEEKRIPKTHKTTTVYMVSGGQGAPNGELPRNYVIQTEISDESTTGPKEGNVDVVSNEKTTKIRIRTKLRRNFEPKEPILVGKQKYDTFPKSKEETLKQGQVRRGQFSFEVPLDTNDCCLTKKVEEILQRCRQTRKVCAEGTQCKPGCNCKLHTSNVCDPSPCACKGLCQCKKLNKTPEDYNIFENQTESEKRYNKKSTKAYEYEQREEDSYEDPEMAGFAAENMHQCIQCCPECRAGGTSTDYYRSRDVGTENEPRPRCVCQGVQCQPVDPKYKLKLPMSNICDPSCACQGLGQCKQLYKTVENQTEGEKRYNKKTTNSRGNENYYYNDEEETGSAVINIHECIQCCPEHRAGGTSTEIYRSKHVSTENEAKPRCICQCVQCHPDDFPRDKREYKSQFGEQTSDRGSFPKNETLDEYREKRKGQDGKKYQDKEDVTSGKFKDKEAKSKRDATHGGSSQRSDQIEKKDTLLDSKKERTGKEGEPQSYRRPNDKKDVATKNQIHDNSDESLDYKGKKGASDRKSEDLEKEKLRKIRQDQQNKYDSGHIKADSEDKKSKYRKKNDEDGEIGNKDRRNLGKLKQDTNYNPDKKESLPRRSKQDKIPDKSSKSYDSKTDNAKRDFRKEKYSDEALTYVKSRRSNDSDSKISSRYPDSRNNDESLKHRKGSFSPQDSEVEMHKKASRRSEDDESDVSTGQHKYPSGTEKKFQKTYRDDREDEDIRNSRQDRTKEYSSEALIDRKAKDKSVKPHKKLDADSEDDTNENVRKPKQQRNQDDSDYRENEDIRKSRQDRKKEYSSEALIDRKVKDKSVKPRKKLDDDSDDDANENVRKSKQQRKQDDFDYRENEDIRKSRQDRKKEYSSEALMDRKIKDKSVKPQKRLDDDSEDDTNENVRKPKQQRKQDDSDDSLDYTKKYHKKRSEDDDTNGNVRNLKENKKQYNSDDSLASTKGKNKDRDPQGSRKYSRDTDDRMRKDRTKNLSADSLNSKKESPTREGSRGEIDKRRQEDIKKLRESRKKDSSNEEVTSLKGKIRDSDSKISGRYPSGRKLEEDDRNKNKTTKQKSRDSDSEISERGANNLERQREHRRRDRSFESFEKISFVVELDGLSGSREERDEDKNENSKKRRKSSGEYVKERDLDDNQITTKLRQHSQRFDEEQDSGKTTTKLRQNSQRFDEEQDSGKTTTKLRQNSQMFDEEQVSGKTTTKLRQNSQRFDEEQDSGKTSTKLRQNSQRFDEEQDSGKTVKKPKDVGRSRRQSLQPIQEDEAETSENDNVDQIRQNKNEESKESEKPLLREDLSDKNTIKSPSQSIKSYTDRLTEPMEKSTREIDTQYRPCYCDQRMQTSAPHRESSKMSQTDPLSPKSSDTQEQQLAVAKASRSDSSDYESDSSETSSSESTTSSSSLHSCQCCKQKNITDSALKSLRRKLSDQAFALCRPCYRQNRMFPSPYANHYSNPTHVCTCYSVIQRTTINEMRQTIRQLDDLNGSLCACTETKTQKKESCRHCNCKVTKTPKKKSKPGIAYMLTFESASPEEEKKERKKRNLEEIKIKIPTHKKRHKEKANLKRKRSEEEENVEPVPTLQEHLEKNRPGFVEEAEGRRKTVASSREEREKDAEEFKLNFLRNYDEARQREKSNKRLFSSREMKEITKKHYQKLPEVQKKLVDHKKKEMKRANKLMADIFNRKLRENVLKGKRSLSVDVNVLNL